MIASLMNFMGQRPPAQPVEGLTEQGAQAGRHLFLAADIAGIPAGKRHQIQSIEVDGRQKRIEILPQFPPLPSFGQQLTDGGKIAGIQLPRFFRNGVAGKGHFADQVTAEFPVFGDKAELGHEQGHQFFQQGSTGIAALGEGGEGDIDFFLTESEKDFALVLEIAVDRPFADTRRPCQIFDAGAVIPFFGRTGGSPPAESPGGFPPFSFREFRPSFSPEPDIRIAARKSDRSREILYPLPSTASRWRPTAVELSDAGDLW